MRWFVVIPPAGAARVVAIHTADAFKHLLGSDNVKVFDSLSTLQLFGNLLKKPDDATATDLLNQSLIVSLFDFKATHFFSGALSPVTLFTLLLLKKHNIRTVHWFYEDYRRATYWQLVLQGYDFFFTIQKGPFPEVCKTNDVQWRFLPTAASLSSTVDISETTRDIDLAFIGIPSSYRIQTLECLALTGIRMAVAGSGWKQYHGVLEPFIISNTWVNEQQCMLILRRTKIGLNLSMDDPSGREDVHVSPRVFDIMAAGALCLTENIALLNESISGCCVETFDTLETLVKKVALLINNPELCQPQRILNAASVQSNHQYINRAETILSDVQSGSLK
jgi:hypothetical protein